MKDRLIAWTSALDDYDGDRILAADLYAGDHWVITKQLVPQFPTLKVRVWVMSPGYGLIDATDKIVPYVATFSPNHSESVHFDPDRSYNDANREWWNYLTQWRPVGILTPRSISELSLKFPKDRLIVVGSKRYLNLLRDDLLRLVGNKDFNKKNLYIVSAGSRRSQSALARYFVPSEKKLRKIIGGGDASLNIRTAKLVLTLLSEGENNIEGVRASINSQLEKIPETPKTARKRVTNIFIRTFIERVNRKNPTVSRTTCLKIFRNKGFACQEERFREIFSSTKLSTAK